MVDHLLRGDFPQILHSKVETATLCNFLRVTLPHQGTPKGLGDHKDPLLLLKAETSSVTHSFEDVEDLHSEGGVGLCSEEEGVALGHGEEEVISLQYSSTYTYCIESIELPLSAVH